MIMLLIKNLKKNQNKFNSIWFKWIKLKKFRDGTKKRNLKTKLILKFEFKKTRKLTNKKLRRYNRNRANKQKRFLSKSNILQESFIKVKLLENLEKGMVFKSGLTIKNIKDSGKMIKLMVKGN